MTSTSVVVPFYGDPEPTLQLIEQLKQQRDCPAPQIIIADDCSPTPFPEVPGVTVVRHSINGGFGSAVNSGAAQAQGDLLFILNSDLELPPNFLAEMSRRVISWGRCVMAPALIEPQGPNAVARQWPRLSTHVVEWLAPLAGLHACTLVRRGLGHDIAGLTATTPIATQWLVGAALVMPTHLFKEVGGFDESFYMNSEEIDLQRRLRAIGTVRVYCPDVVVEHAAGGSSDPEKRISWVVEGWFRYAAKWGQPRRLRMVLECASRVNFIWNALRCLRGAEISPRDVLRREISTIRNAYTKMAT